MIQQLIYQTVYEMMGTVISHAFLTLSKSFFKHWKICQLLTGIGFIAFGIFMYSKSLEAGKLSISVGKQLVLAVIQSGTGKRPKQI